jgi:hypothetical protein
MRARTGQIPGNGKSPRVKVQGIHHETYSKIGKRRSRRAGEGYNKQFSNARRDILPSLKITSNRNNNEGIPNSLLTKCEDWRQAIVDSLNNVCTIEDEASEARITARARSDTMIDGTVYKKGVVQPLLRCITQSKGRELL